MKKFLVEVIIVALWTIAFGLVLSGLGEMYGVVFPTLQSQVFHTLLAMVYGAQVHRMILSLSRKVALT